MLDTVTEIAAQNAIQQLMQLSITVLYADPNQIRKSFDEDALRELAESIKAHGIIQPIIAEPVNDRYRIIAGERRWRAAGIAGLETMPVVVRNDLTTEKRAVLQVIENLQRKDLTLIETIAGVGKLVDAVGLDKACIELGKSKGWVSKHATAVGLPEPILERVRDGSIVSIDIARDLAALAELDEQTASFYLDAIDEDDPQAIESEWRPTRENIRDSLALAKEDYEYERQRTESQPALFDGDKEDQVADPATKAAPEPQWKIDQRAREARLAELTPAFRKLARESRKSILATLSEVRGGAKLDSTFNLTISTPSRIDGDPKDTEPEKTVYKIELRGDTDSAGRIIETLAPGHRIGVHLALTIDQLRKVEALLDKDIGLHTEYFDVRGTVLQAAADTLRATAAGVVDGAATVAQFIAECVRLTGDERNRIKASEAHAAYVEWAGKHGYDPIAINDEKWGQAIIDAGIRKVRSNGWRYVRCDLKGARQ